MKFENKYRLILYKNYLDKGMSVTSYVKYLIAFFGLASRNVTTTLLIAAGYAIACFFIGYYWIHWDLFKAEFEIQNRFNPFVKKMLKRKV